MPLNGWDIMLLILWVSLNAFPECLLNAACLRVPECLIVLDSGGGIDVRPTIKDMDEFRGLFRK